MIVYIEYMMLLHLFKNYQREYMLLLHLFD